MARVREMPSFFLSFRPFPFCVISREEEDKTKMNTEKHNMIDSHPIDSTQTVSSYVCILQLPQLQTAITLIWDLHILLWTTREKSKRKQESKKWHRELGYLPTYLAILSPQCQLLHMVSYYQCYGIDEYNFHGEIKKFPCILIAH